MKNKDIKIMWVANTMKRKIKIWGFYYIAYGEWYINGMRNLSPFAMENQWYCLEVVTHKIFKIVELTTKTSKLRESIIFACENGSSIANIVTLCNI